MTRTLAACIIGFLLDLCLGDPQWFRYHPIRLIGTLISVVEKVTRKLFPKTHGGEVAAGMATVLVVISISYGVPFGILYTVGKLHPLAALFLESIGCYFVLATKSLKVESMKVYTALETEGLAAGRQAVSMIVGRDTAGLDETGVVKAAVETVAENTSDGIIAPMFYLFLGGAPLGFLYKAINTMDSMIGYKNDKYLYFGKCAARLDDVANFLPARFAAILMLFVAFLLPEFDGHLAWRIFLRDRNKSASPNAAQTESVCAGAMQIQLLGDAYYFGKLHHKEPIGDARFPVKRHHIVQVNRLLYGTAIAGMVVGILCSLAVTMLV